jgi:hypothetical protein
MTQAACGPVDPFRHDALGAELAGVTAAAVPEQSKIIGKGKPTTVVGEPGRGPLSLNDLRKAAAIRKSGR